MTYSQDLRIKSLDYIENGGSKAEASRIFGVTTQTLFNWIKRKREGNLSPKRTRKRRPYKVQEEKLKDYIRANPDSYLREIAEELGLATSTVFYGCKRLKITLKKKTPFYKERDEKKRADFEKELEKVAEENRVYVDESGINEYLQRQNGRAPSGEKVYGGVYGNRYHRESFIAAQSQTSIFAPFCYTGTCNTSLFNTWLEKICIPELKPGQVIILDNASFHKSKTSIELIKRAGCEVLFLPPCSPDLNPIEKFWANFKMKVKDRIKQFLTLADAIDQTFLEICKQ